MKFNTTNKSTSSKYQVGKYHTPKYQEGAGYAIKVSSQLNEDDYEEEPQESFLGYTEEQQVSVCLTIPIDTRIREASYYRHVAQRITNTQENDLIKFEIHSPGGAYNGLTALLSAVLRTEATTIAYMNGECHSAASMLALSCDEVQVSPFASMLCHFVRYGTAGKSSDIKAFVDHTHDTGAEVFRGIYWGFLTENEINACIEGKELWLNSVEIQSRLIKREELQKQEEDVGSECEGDCDNCSCCEYEEDEDVPEQSCGSYDGCNTGKGKCPCTEVKVLGEWPDVKTTVPAVKIKPTKK